MIRKKLGPHFLTEVLPRDTLHRLLTQLKALRQASTHYQVRTRVGCYAQIGSFASSSHIFSLQEIQACLVEDYTAACTAALRDVVATRNAIAGLLILQGGWEEAFAEYQTTLEFCRGVEAKQGVKTDAFQVIHCLWNALACCAQRPALQTAEQQEASRTELVALEASFLEKTQARLAQAEQNLEVQAFDPRELGMALECLREWASQLNFGKEVVVGDDGCSYSEEGCAELFRAKYARDRVRTTDSRILQFVNGVEVRVWW